MTFAPHFSPGDRKKLVEALRGFVEMCRLTGPIFTIIGEALTDKFPELAEPTADVRPRLELERPVFEDDTDPERLRRHGLAGVAEARERLRETAP